MAKFDELSKMRKQRDGEQPAQEQRNTPAEITAEQERLAAGEPVGGTPPPDPDESDDDDDEPEGEGETPPADDTVPVRAHERKKPDEKEKAPEGTKAVEIDGRTVFVANDLADAYLRVQEGKVATAKDAETDALADRVAAKLKGTTVVTVPTGETVKTAAEVAADKALADALADVEKHPMPSGELAITDPNEHGKQLQAHIAEQTERTTRKALLEKDVRDAAANRAAATQNQAQMEIQARAQLGEQFYESFKVLGDAARRPIVDVLLEKKWDEVYAYVRTNPFKTRAEGDAFKKKCFDEVAASATAQIVAIQQTGKTTTPAPTPPRVASSKPNEGARPPKPVETKPKEKYPSGSVSAMLSKHKTNKMSPKGAAS